MEVIPLTPGELTRQRIEAICAKHDTDFSIACRYGRVRRNVEARVEIAIYLKEKGWSFPRIGRFLHRNHSTVHFMVRRSPKRPEMRRGLIPENEAPLPSP